MSRKDLQDAASNLLGLANRATPGPWRSMRDGNQYIDVTGTNSNKLVGASRLEGVKRPWNPHAVIAFMKLDAAEVPRFLDTDADFIAMCRQIVPDLCLAIMDLPRNEETP